MAPFETGRRLCLLCEAGDVRYAIEATAVLEVASPDPGGERIRGSLTLKDLSSLLGGAPEGRPGVAVVLDVSPTLATRVKRVIEVADVARDPLFQLPQGVSSALAAATRGAVLHGGRVHLELVADALPARLADALPMGSPPRPVYLLDEPPDRALVFCSEGKLYGVPLAFVSQVVSATDAFCPLPCREGPVAGLFPHAQVLWPVYSAAGLLGAPARAEELVLLAELAGQNVGLSAQRVAGVHQGFRATDNRGEFFAESLGEPALFLDLQRMFS